jgi:hypothetical protein
MNSDDEADSDYALVRKLAIKRRRLISNAAVVGALWLAAPTRHAAPNRRRESPFSWEDHVRSMTALEFRKRYRLTPTGFDVLFGMVRDELYVTDVRQAQNSLGTCIYVYLLFAFRFAARLALWPFLFTMPLPPSFAH